MTTVHATSAAARFRESNLLSPELRAKLDGFGAFAPAEDDAQPPPGAAARRRAEETRTHKLVRLPTQHAKPRKSRVDYFAAATERQKKILDRVAGKIRAAGGDVDSGTLESIELHIFKMCKLVVGDMTGAAGRVFLQRLKNAHASATILRAAFGYVPACGRVPPRFQWASLRARRIVAMGLALAALAKPSRKSGPRNALVVGIGRGAFQCLLADPFDHRPAYEVTVKRTHKDGSKYLATELRKPAQPAVTTIYGTHEPGASAESGQVGYFVALRRAGFVYRQQLSQQYALPCECYGPSGKATSRYWVMGREPRAALPDARWALQAAISSATIVADAIAALEQFRPPDDP